MESSTFRDCALVDIQLYIKKQNFFEFLVDEQESAMRPNEHLEGIGPSVSEHTQRHIQRAFTEMVLSDRGQTGERLPEVVRVARYQDTGRRRDQHKASSMSRRRVAENPTSTSSVSGM